MSAYIDGKPLPAPATLINAGKVEVAKADQVNIACKNTTYN